MQYYDNYFKYFEIVVDITINGLMENKYLFRRNMIFSSNFNELFTCEYIKYEMV